MQLAWEQKWLFRLLTLDTEKEDHLGLALFQAFDAKVNAEITQGVGYNWDAEILVPGRRADAIAKRHGIAN